MNANIVKTQICHNMKFDLEGYIIKGHFFFICEMVLLFWFYQRLCVFLPLEP